MLKAGCCRNRPWDDRRADEHPATVEPQVDRHRLVSDLNIRFRDLLTLDPTVPIPYPAALLIRQAAMQGYMHTL